MRVSLSEELLDKVLKNTKGEMAGYVPLGVVAMSMPLRRTERNLRDVEPGPDPLHPEISGKMNFFMNF